MRKKTAPKNILVRPDTVLLEERGIADAYPSASQDNRNIDFDVYPKIPTRRLVFAIGLLSCFFLLCYWRTCVAIELQWRMEPDYSHGYLIIPLAVILLYSRRQSFPGFSGTISWAGLVLICIAGALRVISSLSYMEFLDGWSMVPWIAGTVWMLAGPRVLWWAMPAIGFLILMVPLPYRVETLLSWKLQSVVTLLSTHLLRVMGLPAISEGNTIWIGELQMLLEEACSGLRIFVGMGAFAFFWASMIQRAWVDRVVVLIAALPLAILANTIRVVACCFSFYFLDDKTATVLHDWEGVLMIFLAAGLLWCVMFFWQKLYFPSVILLPLHQNAPSSSDFIRPVLGQLVPLVSSPLSAQRPKPFVWHWNLPLLLGSVFLTLLVGSCLFAASQYRRSQIASQLSQLAAKAHDTGDFEREARWLSQLSGVEKNPTKSLVRLAFALSKNTTERDKKETARSALMRAIAVLDPIDEKKTIEQLRRELIPILLDLGMAWMNEVERQIILLDATPGDSQSTLWLAKCFYSNAQFGEWRIRNPYDFQRDREYWRWLACQPIGFILEQAVERNPDSVEAASALLETYFLKPDLFDSHLVKVSKDALKNKGLELLARLRDSGDSLAQWKSYACEKMIDPVAAKEFLARVVPQTLHRLQLSNYKNASSVVWDTQIVLTQANQFLSDVDYLKAIDLYRYLIGVKNLSIPLKLLESAYLGLGHALFQSGKIGEAIAILKEGCERIGKKQGLAIFDAYATYACTHADLDEATSALIELDDAINAYSLRLSGVSVPLGEARMIEQNQINMIKWHADVIRAGFDMRKGNSASAINRLIAAVSTQLLIAKPLRVEASVMLARAYSELHQMDLAAQTLEEAVALASENRPLRLQAAKAWERAGSYVRAAENWKAFDDGSFESSLIRLKSIIADPQRGPEIRSDDGAVKLALEQAKLRLSQEKLAGASPKNEWLLDWLELSIAAPEADINQALKQLMHKYPDNAALLSLAIKKFASADNQAMVAEGMKMLEQVKESNPSLWLEAGLTHALQSRDLQTAAEIVRAWLDNPRQDNIDVLEIVLRSLETGVRPEDVLAILHPHLTIANESVLFTAGQLLIELESKRTLHKIVGDSSELPSDPSSDLDRLIDRLSGLEDPTGTLALYLKASRLLEQFLRTRSSDDLRACTVLHAEIERKRPRWPLSMTLAGKIASAQGKADRAVECFRSAVADGDDRISTILELVQQLNLLGYYEEAESAFQKVAARMGYTGQLSGMPVGSLSRGGPVNSRLEMARANTKSRPGDVAGWLSLFQAVQLQMLDPKSDGLALIQEAENAIDEAIDLAGRADSQLWIYKLQFVARYRGLDEARQLIDQLLASEVPEKKRILIGAQSLMQLQDVERAKELLEAALANQPDDVELQLAMADCYRTLGDQTQVLATLEQAVRLAPGRVDIKNSLALALVQNDLKSEALPWERISSLVSVEQNDKDAVEKNQLFHAMLLSLRGGEQKTVEARRLLKSLVDDSESKTANDALRYSILLDQRLWKECQATGDERRSRELSTEIKKGFERLTKRRFPAATDLVQHIEYLLLSGNISEVPGLIERLESLTGVSEQCWALKIRLAHARREPDLISEIIRQTVAKEHAQDRRARVIKLSEILVQNGLKDESVQLLRVAYDDDANYLRSLLNGLASQGEFQQAIDLCMERSKIDDSPEFVSAVADCWMEHPELDSHAEAIEPILERGLKVHPESALMLESLGSLRLSQFRYEDAYRLLEAANRISPESLMTLNNLALAASEIPGKEALGLALIDRAIAKFGRIPDLIDSRGLVQLQNHLYREARQSFDDAFALRPDPIFRIHRIQVELAEPIELDLETVAESLDFERLQQTKLTPRERAVLDQLLAVSKKKSQVID